VKTFQCETDLTLHFYNPGHTPERNETAELRALEDCNCPQPDFQDRDDWCPAGNCPEITNPVFTEVTHLIVHHSAGVNTSSDWAATVRGIWDYHVNSNGWDDVGYNWLVDPNGVLYEGRGDDVRGAHFCGNNTVTDLELSLQNETTVNLTWVDNSTTEDAYLVQRATGVNGNFTTIASLPTDTEVYSDTSPNPETLYRYQVLSMAGDSTSTCQLEAEITTQGTSANENILTREEISILPNPAQNFARILLKNDYIGQVNFELTDVTGKQTSVFKSTEKGTQQIELELNLQDLPTGVYLVRVTAGDHFGTFRLVKQ